MKTLVTTAAAILALVAAAQPAMADRYYSDRWDDGWRGRPHHRHDYYYPGATVYYAPSPPPVVYYNQPAYVAPAPVYAAPAPVYRRAVRCTNAYNPLGALVGGIAGGVIGSTVGHGHGRTAATIGGVVAGSALGGAVVRDCSDEVFQQAAVGVPVTWQDPEGDETYTVTPTKDIRTNGRYCREYQSSARVGGRTQQTYGTACMQPDGSWEIVD